MLDRAHGTLGPELEVISSERVDIDILLCRVVHQVFIRLSIVLMAFDPDVSDWPSKILNYVAYYRHIIGVVGILQIFTSLGIHFYLRHGCFTVNNPIEFAPMFKTPIVGNCLNQNQRCCEATQFTSSRAAHFGGTVDGTRALK